MTQFVQLAFPIPGFCNSCRLWKILTLWMGKCLKHLQLLLVQLKDDNAVLYSFEMCFNVIFFIRNFHCFAFAGCWGREVGLGELTLLAQKAAAVWSGTGKAESLFGVKSKSSHELVPSQQGKEPDAWKIPKMSRRRIKFGLLELFPPTNCRPRKKKQDCDGNITRWVTHISPSTPWKEQAKRKEGFDLEVIQMHRGDR